jgi:hypothetical protein
MAGAGANRLGVGRLSRHRPDGESRREPDDRMPWKGTAMMPFAPFRTINSVLSNEAEFRLQSHHVVGVPMENQPPMTRRDGASKLHNRTNGANGPMVIRLARHMAGGRQSRSSNTDLQLKSNDAACRPSELTRKGTNRIDGGGVSELNQSVTSLKPPARWRETACAR